MKPRASSIIIFILLLIMFILILISYTSKTTEPSINITDIIGIITPPKTKINYSSPYPIILVHGWLGKAIDFTGYANQLQKDVIAEKKPIILNSTTKSVCPEQWDKAVSVRAEYYYPYNTNKGIETYAKELNHAVNLVTECTGSEQVIIIAHSMGGLVSRKYMVDYGDEKVNKLIALATPHYGFNQFTRAEIILLVLDLFTGRIHEVDQMRPGSDFLNELNNSDLDYRHKIVSIGTYDVGEGSSKIFDLSFLPKSDIVVRLDSTQLKNSKHYGITGCAHTEITDFRVLNKKGSIKDPKLCSEAYDIVKNEIVLSQEGSQ